MVRSDLRLMAKEAMCKQRRLLKREEAETHSNAQVLCPQKMRKCLALHM
jgi:hypothetical protein